MARSDAVNLEVHWNDEDNQMSEIEFSSPQSLDEQDMRVQTEAMRQESAFRLDQRAQRLSRFHGQICQRVTARTKQNRIEAARSARMLSDKCANMIRATSRGLRKDGAHQDARQRPSCRTRTATLIQDKAAAMDTSCPLFADVQQALRHEASLRNFLLSSTAGTCGGDSAADIRPERHAPWPETATATLEPQQRVELYATVRRQYMAVERAKSKSFGRPRAASSKPKPSVQGRSVLPDQPLGDYGKSKQWSTRVVDATAECEVRVHRHIPTSSTPWRSSSSREHTSKKPTPLRQDKSRFLAALQLEVGAPAVCSCGGLSAGKAPSKRCANNCALYKQPQKREKLLAAVCEQQSPGVQTL